MARFSHMYFTYSSINYEILLFQFIIYFVFTHNIPSIQSWILTGDIPQVTLVRSNSLNLKLVESRSCFRSTQLHNTICKYIGYTYNMLVAKIIIELPGLK